jgi:hypothetical protein
VEVYNEPKPEVGMAAVEYYRGGNSLKPKLRDLRFDPVTQFVRETHGVSVFSRPDGLERFGGAFRLSNIPDELRIIRRGLDPYHFEIVPIQPMPLDEYEAALQKIVLTPV